MTPGHEDDLAGAGLTVRDGVRIDLVGDLRAAILRLADEDPRGWTRGAGSLNVGGWKSTDLEARVPSARLLVDALARDHLASLSPSPRVVSWAMVNRAGSHHPRHNHRTAAWSGVYYVDPGEAPTVPTLFELADGREVEVWPSAGRLVLFPGWMYHRVPPYRGQAPRVTIALDVPR